MKRRGYLFLLFLLLVTVSVVGLSLFRVPEERRFTKEQLSRLKEGMQSSEVEAVLGVAPGDYTNGTGRYYFRDDDFETLWSANDCYWGPRSQIWCGSDGAIHARFDEKGHLETMHYSLRLQEPTIWQRIIQWMPMKK